jgi:hypothetical protein
LSMLTELRASSCGRGAGVVGAGAASAAVARRRVVLAETRILEVGGSKIGVGEVVVMAEEGNDGMALW